MEVITLESRVKYIPSLTTYNSEGIFNSLITFRFADTSMLNFFLFSSDIDELLRRRNLIIETFLNLQNIERLLLTYIKS